MQPHYPDSRPRAPLGWRFWLTTLAALVAMAVTASLGRWQLSRAAEKQSLQAAMQARASQPPVPAAALPAASGGRAAEALQHRRVQLRGHWAAQATVFLDNRQMYGRPGFYVFTPLRLAGDEAAVVLVQRGWVPRDFMDRTRLPEVATPAGEVVVQGRVAGPPSRLYEFAPAAAQGSSRIRQNLDMAAFAAETGLPLLPHLTVVQGSDDGAGPDGLSRDWPAVDSGVDKHYGYAFQWFGLCALVTILYVWFQLVRRFARPRP